MSHLSSIITGVKLEPPRIVLYGPEGVGKTTFGAAAPSPIFLPFEDGQGKLNAPRFPRITEWAQLMAYMNDLITGQHNFKAAVLDTADWLEPIVWKQTCLRNKWASIEDPGYGKGYLAACDEWLVVLRGLDRMRDRGMMVIVLAHSQIKTFKDPAVGPYDRYEMKLQSRGCDLLREWSDAVLFATYKVDIAKTDVGFKKVVTRGSGDGVRTIWTQERPSHQAKNRYGMSPEVPMEFGAVMADMFKP